MASLDLKSLSQDVSIWHNSVNGDTTYSVTVPGDPNDRRSFSFTLDLTVQRDGVWEVYLDKHRPMGGWSHMGGEQEVSLPGPVVIALCSLLEATKAH